MHTKRINNLGRIMIPKELLEMFELKEGNLIDVTYTDRQIILEPHRQRHVCAVTGEVANEAIRIGEARFSREDLKHVVKYMSDE